MSDQQSDQETPEPTPSLPTGRASSGSPSTPSDSFKKVRVVGTVVGQGPNGCVDVADANGVLWSLTGPDTEDLAAGDRVVATGQALPESGECAGAAVRVQKLTRQD